MASGKRVSVSRTKLDGSHVPSHGILGDGVLSLAQARSQTPYDERKLKDEVPATVGNMYCGLEMQIFLAVGNTVHGFRFSGGRIRATVITG